MSYYSKESKKNNKAPGSDGIKKKHIIFGGLVLIDEFFENVFLNEVFITSNTSTSEFDYRDSFDDEIVLITSRIITVRRIYISNYFEHIVHIYSDEKFLRYYRIN